MRAIVSGPGGKNRGGAVATIVAAGRFMSPGGRRPSWFPAGGGIRPQAAASTGGTGPVQRHRHGLASHAHPTASEHVHIAGFALARRPLAVGVVHGLAGSGAVTALVTSSLPTFPEQLIFVLFFGCGSAIGMAAMAGLAGWPLARFVQTPAAGAALSAVTGVAALVLGVVWLHPPASTLFPSLR